MKCKQYKNLIMRYFDHDLKEEEKDILNSHIDSCSACKALFNDLNVILNSVEQSPQIEVDAWLEKSVLAQIKSLPAFSEKDENLPSKIIYRIAGLAALTAVVFTSLSSQAGLADLFFAAVGYVDSALKHIWNIQVVYDITYGFYAEAVNAMFRTIQCVFTAGVISAAILCLKNAMAQPGKIESGKIIR